MHFKNPCAIEEHRKTKLPPFCPICLAEERDTAKRKIEKVREWKKEYGGLRTEYIAWDELEFILSELTD